ncbi:MAG: alanine racemase [Actinobacteria bacterium]|jgi:alanine racemase|nr:alanine racemase [Actinomycetota bacterium]
MKISPRSSVLIDLAAIRHNVAHLLSTLAPGNRLLVAVKADGYGHGTLPVARSAVTAGAQGVAVATAEEAVALRDAGYAETILVMGPLYSFDQYEEMARRDVDFAVVSDRMAAMLPGLQGSGLRARVHLKIDSGMNRQGLFSEEVGPFLESIRGIPEVELAGVMTHFACVPEDPATVDFQLGRFLPAVKQVRREWPGVIAHAANSAATLHSPNSHLDMVRCGCAVYGLSPWQGDAMAEGLRPALAWKSQVALVKRVAAGEGVGYGHAFRTDRPTDVALVPIGYGDGVSRAFSNQGEVLINGRRYPVAGRISMDSFAVDVGTDGNVKVSDTVTLIGADGEDRITVEDLARRQGTINYEITCDIALDRTERRFLNGDA